MQEKSIIDWGALFTLTSAYLKVPKPTKVFELTDADNQWVEDETYSVQFNENDDLKLKIDSLKEANKEVKKRMQ